MGVWTSLLGLGGVGGRALVIEASQLGLSQDDEGSTTETSLNVLDT